MEEDNNNAAQWGRKVFAGEANCVGMPSSLSGAQPV